MYSCDAIDEAWYYAVETLVEHGTVCESRNGNSTEVIGWGFTLTDPSANFLFSPTRKMDPAYAGAELLWYLSGLRTTELIRAYAPSYEKFCEQNGGNPYAHGAYGHRMAGAGVLPHEEDWDKDPPSDKDSITGKYTQISGIVRALKKHPESRQAVLGLWRPDWDLRSAETLEKKDIPCTLSVQFLLRAGELHAVTTMRSQDIWLGMPYDVFCWTCIQHLIAEALGVKVGTYTHLVGSLHVYEKQRERAFNALHAPGFNVDSLKYDRVLGPVSDGIKNALRIEDFARHNVGAGMASLEDIRATSVLGVACLLAGSRWDKGKSAINLTKKSKYLNRYLEEFYDGK